METRANYVIVGIFTMVAILAAFAFVYWTAAIGDRGEIATAARAHSGFCFGPWPRQCRAVQRRQGWRRAARLSSTSTIRPSQSPTREIDRLTPITKSTQADIGLAGLTGQANIELKGADPKEAEPPRRGGSGRPRRRDHRQPVGGHQPACRRRKTSSRAPTRCFPDLEGFTKDVRGPLTQTVENAKTFLRRPGQECRRHRQIPRQRQLAVGGTGGRLRQARRHAEGRGRIAQCGRSKDQIKTIVANVDTFTTNLKETSKQFDTVIKNVNTAVGSINDFAQKTQGTLGKVDGVLDGVDPAEVRTALANIAEGQRKRRQGCPPTLPRTPSKSPTGPTTSTR